MANGFIVRKVYLDNNVLIDIESNKYQFEDFVDLPNVEYYYSEAHIGELLNGTGKHPELKNVRLQTIERLCCSRYIAPDVANYVMEIEERAPLDIFELYSSAKPLHDAINKAASMNVNREGILTELSLNKVEVGNIKTEDIFNAIEQMMQRRLGFGIKEYINMGICNSGRTIFSTLFNLLDSVCYWRDKNDVARFYDSSHAYFAQLCDVLVTNDKKMRVKSKAVYSYLGINTNVYSVDDFLVH